MVLHPEKGQGAECGSPILNVVFFPVDHVPLEGWKLRKNGRKICVMFLLVQFGRKDMLNLTLVFQNPPVIPSEEV